jgi:hypothetical protein
MNTNIAVDDKFLHFTNHVRRQELGRFIVQYELFKKISHIKGSIVECGVYKGSGIMAYAKISEILEPYNFNRKIIGFDTFEGFPSVDDKDTINSKCLAEVGRTKPNYDTYNSIQSSIEELNKTRLLNHQDKVVLVKGDAMKTIPDFLKENQHTLVSLLYLDFDLYEPTLLALREFLPRMPKGSIVAFDELNDHLWPGETTALLEELDLNKYKLESMPFEPHISWIII